MRLLIIIGLIAIVYSCASGIVEPITAKDPADYNWSIDTIKYNDPDIRQSLLSSLWGSSAKDVYLVGHTDAGGKIMHYDGISWKEIDFYKMGLMGGKELEMVYGFSADDVWICGQSQVAVGQSFEEYASFYHFDGSKWVKHFIPAKLSFLSISGDNSKNLWLCGEKGIISYYNGATTKVDTLKIGLGNDNHFVYNTATSNGERLALSYKVPYQYLHKEINNHWVAVDSFSLWDGVPKFGTGNLFRSLNGRLFSYGNYGVWEYVNGFWIKRISTDTGVTGMVEYKEGNFIVVDFRGKVYKYDGFNSTLIKDFGNDSQIYDVWANNEECFIVGYKSGTDIKTKSFVYHGK